MLIIIVWIKNIEFGMNLFGRMGAKFQFTVNQVLNHLEHTVLNLLGIVRLFDVLFQQSQAFFLYFLLCTKEEFTFLVGTGNILVNIDTNQYAYFVDAVKKWT